MAIETRQWKAGEIKRRMSRAAQPTTPPLWFQLIPASLHQIIFHNDSSAQISLYGVFKNQKTGNNIQGLSVRLILGVGHKSTKRFDSKTFNLMSGLWKACLHFGSVRAKKNYIFIINSKRQVFFMFVLRNVSVCCSISMVNLILFC